MCGVSRYLPEVLAVRLELFRGLKKWDLMEAVARKLTPYDPDDVQWWISWAFATRRSDSIEAARAILVKAVEQHFDVAVVHSNLACYECQLGNLELAKGHLKLSFKIKKRLRLNALDEPDLEPLWDSLGTVAD